MGIEAATYVSGLVDSNPLGSDNISEGDEHIRLIKSVLQNTFPDADAAFTLYASSGFYATKDSQTVGSGSETLMTFPNEVFDIKGEYDTSTSKFTPTTAGKYLIHYTISAQSPSSALSQYGKVLQAILYTNGSKTHELGGTLQPYDATLTEISSQLTVIVEANGSGDYYQPYMYQNTTQNVVCATGASTRFMAIRVG